MMKEYIDIEIINHYDYKGKECHVELFYTEGEYIEAFASFQIDVDMETDDMVGVGDDLDKNKKRTIVRAIEHLHSEFS
ncbi:hypothetical protein R4Z10_19555 [Niallia sp. XMNu-256]|uniref:hypothetical protein n=1 Tax=Niallia sp. XMNu-256 TaxID=3082444 RepID=UPI0030D3B164